MWCGGCEKDKDEDSFAWKSKAAGTRQSRCKDCKGRYNKTWYADNAAAHKVRVAQNNRRYDEELQALIRELKSVPCMDCGRSFPPCAMDFDHVNGQKIMIISRMTSHGRASLEKIKAEIAKCEVVCAVCHRIRTYARAMAEQQSAGSSVDRAAAF